MTQFATAKVPKTAIQVGTQKVHTKEENRTLAGKLPCSFR
jgi:hypothetical protein